MYADIHDRWISRDYGINNVRCQPTKMCFIYFSCRIARAFSSI
jgi:hypothetical protein